MIDAIELTATLNDWAEQTRQLFNKRFGRTPEWLVAAPGRVNMIGDHVDYNDGFVLPFAIDRYTLVAADLATDAMSTISTIHSVGFKDSVSIDLADPIIPSAPDWSNYVKGVMHGFREHGSKLPAVDMLIVSAVPPGSGLSSSAALEVAIATMLEVVTNSKLDNKEKALLCQKAEHDFAKVPCGIMDQFVSVFGQENSLLLLDCHDLSMKQISFDHDELALLVINSNVQHELATSEYSLRREQCMSAASLLGLKSLRELEADVLESSRRRLPELFYQRVRHVVSENDRTVRFADYFSTGHLREAGELLFQSHESLRNDYAVSCDELDRLVELAREIGVDGGVYGSRMTGGGFGGATISLVEKDAAIDIANRITKKYNQTSKKSATAFLTSPSRGAHQF